MRPKDPCGQPRLTATSRPGAGRGVTDVPRWTRPVRAAIGAAREETPLTDRSETRRQDARAARVAAALKANVARRKAQARARAEGGAAPERAKEGDDPDG